MANIHVGTSGWQYRHWRGGAFYPTGLKQRQEFAHYASLFDTVEINGSFYRLPIAGTPEAWRDQAPEGFLYAWKYPRWLTHYYRLKDPEESYSLVFGRMKGLGAKAGPVLFHLHPNMKVDEARLLRALRLLPKRQRASFEFRHPSWYAKPVFRLLEDFDAALCISDHHDAPAPWERTASWVYVRCHGPGGAYHGSYAKACLQAWAKRLRSWQRQGVDVFCYFDNDPEAAAPRNALQLKKLVASATGRPQRQRKTIQT
jgi:uncharacterized protein YecE (DUF72 family)